MFWANSAADEQITADLITLGVCVFWGDSLHRLFFFFSIPTHAELLMW